MRMGVRELEQRFSGDPSLAKLLAGMAAALDAMESIRQEALDISQLQHGEKLRPKLSSVDIHHLVDVKLRALAEHIPRGKIKVGAVVPRARACPMPSTEPRPQV